MKTVGIRALKHRLAEYLRLVRSGERVTVTRRGVPVADLIPHAPHGLDPDDELLRWARAGRVRLGNPDAKAGYTRPPKEDQLPHDELMAILDWTRADREVFLDRADEARGPEIPGKSGPPPRGRGKAIPTP